MEKEKKEKEIGTLIELLNEYLSSFSGYIHYHNENGFKRTPTKSAVEGDRMLQDEYICSKKFGFIKWLVENDKININEEWDNYEKTNLYCNSDFFQLQKHYSYYESLLMLLSISDTPIDNLISYLR